VDTRKIPGLFPQLKERLKNCGAQLSGGEEQLLAISRALTSKSLSLLPDEATEGLTPLILDEIWSSLELLKTEGQTTLVIDKELKKLLH